MTREEAEERSNWAMNILPKSNEAQGAEMTLLFAKYSYDLVTRVVRRYLAEVEDGFVDTGLIERKLQEAANPPADPGERLERARRECLERRQRDDSDQANLAAEAQRIHVRLSALPAEKLAQLRDHALCTKSPALNAWVRNTPVLDSPTLESLVWGQFEQEQANG